MKLILHVGMHKTGSSSIQGTFHRFDSEKLAYLDLGHPNHSAVFMTLFRSDPENYIAHRRNQRTANEVLELKNSFQQRIRSFIDENSSKDFVASGEDISLLSEDEVQSMKEYFDQFFSEHLIIAYARPPFSLMSSLAQQRVVGGVSIHPKHLYPGYRDRLEKFDIVFGQENVVVTKFHPDSMQGEDVVADFADKIGVDLSDLTVSHQNVGRSVETVAIMLAQRKLGKGFRGYPNSPRDNKIVVDLLSSIGSTKTLLHPEYLADVIEEQREDLEWITERLGEDFVDQPTEVESAIRSVDQLIDISTNCLPDVLEVMARQARKIGKTDPEFVARAVDLLIDMVRERRERRFEKKP